MLAYMSASHGRPSRATIIIQRHFVIKKPHIRFLVSHKQRVRACIFETHKIEDDMLMRHALTALGRTAASVFAVENSRVGRYL